MTPPPSHTLDPDDWPALRALGHRMLDDMFDWLQTVRDRPVWVSPPSDVRSALDTPVPVDGEGAAAAYDDFLRLVRPYAAGNLHPRFFGWVKTNGTPLGMLADMLASGLNPLVAGFDQAPALVEAQVVGWMAELMGLPPGSGGLFTSGGSMANLLAIATARHARAGFDVRAQGLQAAGAPHLTVYASTECHSWIDKTVEVLGLGQRGLRRVPVDAAFRLDVDALREAIAADRAAGARPFAVVATAGTVNTGAIDPLSAIAQLCREHGLWLHVDGAFGAFARLAPSLAPRVAGLEHADSLAIDLHKWMYQPYECACLLVRDPAAQRACFAVEPAYLDRATRGLTAGGLPFADAGLDLTRGFKALKAWMALKAHGVSTFSALIAQNVAQAEYVAARIADAPDLELTAPVSLNVVCCRYLPPDARIAPDALNQELLLRLQESGTAIVSSTRLRGRFALRAAFVNHRTTWADLDELVEVVRRIGREVARDLA